MLPRAPPECMAPGSTGQHTYSCKSWVRVALVMHCTTGAVWAAAAGLAPAQAGGIYWEPPLSRLCKNTMLQVYTLCITSVSCKNGCPDSGNHCWLPCEESLQSSILQGREVSSPVGRCVLYINNMYVLYKYCNCLFLAGRQPLHGTGFERLVLHGTGLQTLDCLTTSFDE